MWFKNIYLFRLLESFNYNDEELADKLAARRANRCEKTEFSSLGWVSPFGGDYSLVHACDKRYLIAVCKEEKILPASVIRDSLQEEILEIQQTQDRIVGRKEKLALREEIIFTLLPRAFTRQRLTYAYIDTQQKWLIIDTANANRAEECANLLRDTLGSLKICLPETRSSLTTTMSDWLLNNRALSTFTIQDYCEMIDIKMGNNIIKCQGQDLTAPEVHTHLRSGKQVVNLALCWQERLSFILRENFSLRSIRCLEVLEEKLKQANTDSDLEKLDADFALMSAEFAELLTQLSGVFNGFVEIT